MRVSGMKFVQSFHLQQLMKNENFSLTSLTCLPQLHDIENFTWPIFGDLREDGSETSSTLWWHPKMDWRNIYDNTSPFYLFDGIIVTRNYSISASCDYDEIRCLATIRLNRIVL